jgi:hypothetical protein
MNSNLVADYPVAIALQGRVPVKVIGSVRKGDLLVSAENGFAMVNNSPAAGTIIGKSIEDFTATAEVPTGMIIVVVGRD